MGSSREAASSEVKALENLSRLGKTRAGFEIHSSTARESGWAEGDLRGACLRIVTELSLTRSAKPLI